MCQSNMKWIILIAVFLFLVFSYGEESIFSNAIPIWFDPFGYHRAEITRTVTKHIRDTRTKGDMESGAYILLTYISEE